MVSSGIRRGSDAAVEAQKKKVISAVMVYLEHINSPCYIATFNFPREQVHLNDPSFL